MDLGWFYSEDRGHIGEQLQAVRGHSPRLSLIGLVITLQYAYSEQGVGNGTRWWEIFNIGHLVDGWYRNWMRRVSIRRINPNDSRGTHIWPLNVPRALFQTEGGMCRGRFNTRYHIWRGSASTEGL